MEEIIYHTRAVARGRKRALVVGDMPFLSYQVSREEAIRNAGRFLQEGGAEGVKLRSEAGIDILLVGDSVGCVFQGQPNTLTVTMEEIIYHTRAVARGRKRALVVGDMPFLSYQVSREEAIRNAGRFLQEGGAEGVKL